MVASSHLIYEISLWWAVLPFLVVVRACAEFCTCSHSYISGYCFVVFSVIWTRLWLLLFFCFAFFRSNCAFKKKSFGYYLLCANAQCRRMKWTLGRLWLKSQCVRCCLYKWNCVVALLLFGFVYYFALRFAFLLLLICTLLQIYQKKTIFSEFYYYCLEYDWSSKNLLFLQMNEFIYRASNYHLKWARYHWVFEQADILWHFENSLRVSTNIARCSSTSHTVSPPPTLLEYPKIFSPDILWHHAVLCGDSIKSDFCCLFQASGCAVTRAKQK